LFRGQVGVAGLEAAYSEWRRRVLRKRPARPWGAHEFVGLVAYAASPRPWCASEASRQRWPIGTWATNAKPG